MLRLRRRRHSVRRKGACRCHGGLARLLMYGVGVCLAGCGVAPGPAAQPSGGAPIVAGASAAPAPAPAIVTPSPTPVHLSTRSSAQPTPAPTAARLSDTGSNTQPTDAPDPVERLRRALELADTEMRAADASRSLAEAKKHAEAVVNILVGYWGRWYGDADKDGIANDPSDRRGVLPGERIPSAAPDTAAAHWPVGWGITVYEKGGPAARQAVQATIMGDVERWKKNAAGRYGEIERAIAGTDLSRDATSKLDGRAMRAVAWARLILTKAASLDDAKIYAGHGVADTSASLEATRTIK
jgi:hypothetical protein